MKEWKILVADLQLAVPVSIPRTFFHELGSPLVSATLCGFCDASARAYGCVVYLVLRTNSTVAIQFVAAKTRIAPLNGQTVPRLELLSALLLSRLIASVQNSLSSQRLHLDVYCFTDSLVGLYWIRGRDREWKPFVQNRVVEIHRSVQPDQWYHCPGITNPADLPSRGLSIVELSSSLLWRTGLEFLKNAIPPDPVAITMTMPELCLREFKSATKSTNLLLIQNCSIGNLLPCDNFSSLQKLLRITAHILRAVSQFKAKSTLQSLPVLSPEDIASAQVLWIIQVQEQLVQLGYLEVWQSITECRYSLCHQISNFVASRSLLHSPSCT